MRIIALMNQKGGVGKTTTTVNLGAALAEQGKKVCLIDLDPQAHLTINYGVDPSPELPSLYQMLIEEKSFLECVHKIDDNIALVPSSIDLAAAEIELVSVLGREMLLKKRIEAAQHDFEYILLDCPPSLGLLTINSLAVAGEVIIPMQPHFLALQGVGKLLETVALVSKRMNPSLKVSGIVLTMFDAQTKLSNEVVNDLNGFIESAAGKNLPWANARIFKSKIRRNIKLAECPSFGQTILKYEPTSHGAADYRALAEEVSSMNAEIAPKVAPKIEKTAVKPETITPPSKPPAPPVVAKPAPAPVSAPIPAPHPARPRVPASSASPLQTTVNVSIDQSKLSAATVAAPIEEENLRIAAPPRDVQKLGSGRVNSARVSDKSNAPSRRSSRLMQRSPFLRRLAWIITAVYWVALFVLTHIPGPALPDIHVNDKIEHTLAYGLLGTLLFVSLSIGQPRRMNVALIVLSIGIAYGAMDEWLQAVPFIHRSCELSDWTADVAGVAVAVVAASFVRMWWMARSGMGDSPVSS